MKNQQTNEQLNIGNTSTPYDDACRTLLTDCSKLIIPVVNEAFQTNHGETENVTLFNNEFFYTMSDNTQRKRIVDSNFTIGTVRYHLECQSTPDGSIMWRVFEKKLFFILPFHLFTYEVNFPEYESNEEKRTELMQHYANLMQRLDACVDAGELNIYEKNTIVAMIKKVKKHLLAKYSKLEEGLGVVMRGTVLDYEAKDIKKGEAKDNARELFRNGVSYEIVRASIKILSDEELQEIYESVTN